MNHIISRGLNLLNPFNELWILSFRFKTILMGMPGSLSNTLFSMGLQIASISGLLWKCKEFFSMSEPTPNFQPGLFILAVKLLPQGGILFISMTDTRVLLFSGWRRHRVADNVFEKNTATNTKVVAHILVEG